MRWGIAVIMLVCGCNNDGSHAPSSPHTPEDDGSMVLTRAQMELGCLPMGEGEARHVMCNHGHSLNFRSENLYSRWEWLNAQGVAPITEADLMMTSPHDGMLPDPMTPVFQAQVGERVKIRLVSYGPEMHDFHVHGHLWKDNRVPYDVHPLMPAQVYDGVEFYAGAGAEDPTPRAGAGDWMYHCHVEPHIVSGMWGIFRVSNPGDHTGVDAQGRYSTELPAPLGGEGQTVDVWVVAAEAPLAVAREFNKTTTSLQAVERMARLYVPMADEAAFLAATPTSVQQMIRAQQATWVPWVLVLRLGTTVRVHLRNIIPSVPVSLHPHGVRYALSEDGTNPDDIAWAGGVSVTSTWTADTPGTWPLHDHARSIENIGRGLFSAIVVKTPEEEARIERDYLLIFHDYDMNWMMGMPDNTAPSAHPH